MSFLLQGILESHGLSISIEIIFENYTKQQSLFGASKYFLKCASAAFLIKCLGLCKFEPQVGICLTEFLYLKF